MTTDIEPDAAGGPAGDTPLPATMLFVFSIGGMILVGWIAMFFLMRARW